MLKAGDIVISKAGHDMGRTYAIVATLNDDFILVCDGKYRPCDNPKTKRAKHVRRIGESTELVSLINKDKLTSANIICEIKKFTKPKSE